MPSACCPICFDSFSLSTDKPEIVIYPCSHGCCTQCSDALLSEESPKCPSCRATLSSKDGHSVYLEFVDSESSDTSDQQRDSDEIEVLRTEFDRSNRDRDRWENWAIFPQTKVDRLALSLEEAESNTNELICVAEAREIELEELREISLYLASVGQC
ncbi:hypothetical protein GALMADRAFT_273480 [Galerina marginata CBS 339.88]|uniref:RING-type domain-containing protein n=1 Tax=Galerina marginata (strain CBS 339.88) TaxID=685588 RepID=A0A067S6X8_GALM3|nr:hypothetical protein GALMADRAFT_273480 [Galerina marginata CBS 339.88]